jgi:hypothetical protein
VVRLRGKIASCAARTAIELKDHVRHKKLVCNS